MFSFQIFLHQEVKRNQNIPKEPTFGAACSNMTCLLTLRLRNTNIWIFPDYFSFGHFLASSCFQTLRLRSFNSALHFGQNKSRFCRLNVLVCCCAANQRNYHHIFKNFKTVHALRVNEVSQIFIFDLKICSGNTQFP